MANSYSGSNGDKVAFASALVSVFPNATNVQINAMLKRQYGSGLRNTTLATVRRTASTRTTSR